MQALISFQSMAQSLGSWLETAGWIAVCVLLFSLAIAIHEFGHFIVALKLGLKVERFSIGFGPAIWKLTRGGVEYRISWIPLGGYVSIPEVDPEGTKKIEGGGGAAAAERKQRIPAWKELAVAFAGPAMNIVLAAVLATILAFAPGARFSEPTMEVGSIAEGGAAEKAGLRIGDTVKAVNGRAVGNWIELCCEMQYSTNATAVLDVERPVFDRLEIEITPEKGIFGDIWAVGVMSAGVVRGDKLLPWIGEVSPGSPAMKAGLAKGDAIVSVDGRPAERWEDFSKAVLESGGRTLKMGVTRKNASAPPQKLRLETNVSTNGIGMLAIDAAPAMSGSAPWMPSRNPLAQLEYDAEQIFYILKRLCTDTKETSKQLGGPVMIAENIYTNIRRDTWDGLGFLRFLNMNLAILNLLPVPVLDGGLILFALIAIVFRRRVPDKAANALSTVFMWLLLAGMAILVWRDAERSWKMHRAEKAAAEEAPADGGSTE